MYRLFFVTQYIASATIRVIIIFSCIRMRNIDLLRMHIIIVRNSAPLPDVRKPHVTFVQKYIKRGRVSNSWFVWAMSVSRDRERQDGKTTETETTGVRA